ncbi:SET domain-containing protein [Termitomyces sp. J132]|nr:SET domain-containing protein [Termitomyces sp. J132]
MSTTANVVSFRNWLAEHGGGFHRQAQFVEVPSGFSILAVSDLPADTTVVECPFDLAITEELAQRCLLQILDLKEEVEISGWTERQWISLYLCCHWIFEKSRSLHLNVLSHLLHYAYVKTLPSASKLRTPLHFTRLELELFQGTNLYGAALDRERVWRAEWSQCRNALSKANPEWGSKFSWEYYLTASTYLSSRAFPSSLLSPAPSLLSSPDTKPVLLPGIDALNHGRKQPVSWVVSYADSDVTSRKKPKISLVLHSPFTQGQELLNNYGAKPNSELILGYGFALSQNPDDTIVLKIGGSNERWEIGRSARGAEGLWNEILTSVQQTPEFSSYEDQLDAASTMLDMLQALVDRLPPDRDDRRVNMRPEVAIMLDYYVEGQRDILESLMNFAHEKARLAIDQARAEGIEIVLED